jgi:hypothetical protein
MRWRERRLGSHGVVDVVRASSGTLAFKRGSKNFGEIVARVVKWVTWVSA